MSSSCLESSEDPIPDGKEAAIILVQAIPISSVVNLMVGGGIEDQPQGPEVSHQLRMNPELEEKNKLWVDQKLRRGNEESSREIEPVGQLKQT